MSLYSCHCPLLWEPDILGVSIKLYVTSIIYFLPYCKAANRYFWKSMIVLVIVEYSGFKCTWVILRRWTLDLISARSRRISWTVSHRLSTYSSLVLKVPLRGASLNSGISKLPHTHPHTFKESKYVVNNLLRCFQITNYWFWVFSHFKIWRCSTLC